MKEHRVVGAYRYPALFSVLLVFSICMGAGVKTANAQLQAFPNSPSMQVTTHTVQAKGKPDECWAYLATPSPLPMFSDPNDCARYNTTPPAKPKVNQSYIWGMAETEDSVWFGTFANGNCVTQAGSGPAGGGNPNNSPNAYATESWVCEFYDSPYFPGLYPNALIGDARTPRNYQYNKTTRQLTDRTPKFQAYVEAARNPEGLPPLLIQTRGIRAAAAYNNVVVMAGPNLSPANGLSFFGWNATTGQFLGFIQVRGFNNIRQFLNLNGTLYTAVGTNDLTGRITGGAILRVNPTLVPNCTFDPLNPFPCFLLNGGTKEAPAAPTIVGRLASVAGVITAHNGRIFTATWPAADLPGSMATLYMSPTVPVGGLTAANATQWSTLWKASDYEPDPNMAQFYAGGGIASFDGYLWWGTLHIPMSPFQNLIKKYPPLTQEEGLQDIAGTFRSTVLFRIKDPDTNPQIDLVYGNYKLPVATAPAGPGLPVTWNLQVNNMNRKSLYGPSGYGNIWNTYTWSATTWNNRLWIGTMDWAFTSQQGVEMLSKTHPINLPPNLYSNTSYGADYLYFTSADKAAFPESTNGIDNPTTFGVRNQLRSANGSLYLGMANAMNLVTLPADAAKFGGLGGWELIELKPRTDLNTPAGTDVTVNLAGNASVKYCNVTTPGMTVSSTVNNPFRQEERFMQLLSPYGLNAPTLPPGINGQPARVMLLWSTALWGRGCPSPALATVSVPYAVNVKTPRLLQLLWNGSEYVWTNITTSFDAATRKVNGTLTSDFLGLIAVSEAEAPRVQVKITGQGFDPAKNSYYVDLAVSNSGLVPAYNVILDQVKFNVTGGTGVVTYNALNPALPASIGNVAVSATKPLRVYISTSTSFGSRAGVTRMTVTETLKLTDGIGESFTVPFDQMVMW